MAKYICRTCKTEHKEFHKAAECCYGMFTGHSAYETMTNEQIHCKMKAALEMITKEVADRAGKEIDVGF